MAARPPKKTATAYDKVASKARLGKTRKPPYDPKKRQLVAPEQAEFGEETFAPEGAEWVDADTGEPLPIEGSPTGASAPISVLPTSSVSPNRPRTLAAGYDRDTRTLSVVFRDGTPWNYYEVTPLEWANFKRAKSKGRFIRLYLNLHPYGPPVGGDYESQSSYAS